MSDYIDKMSFHDSIKTFNLDTVKQAFSRDPSQINTFDPKVGWPPLYKAVVYEQKEITEFLLVNGADPNITNRIGETAIHYAVETGYSDLVDLLVRYGADPNIKQGDGDSPLHMACKRKEIEMMRILLQAKANPNAQNKFAKTPLHIAGDLNNKEMFVLLLEYNADPNIPDKWKRKPRQLVDPTTIQPQLKSQQKTTSSGKNNSGSSASSKNSGRGSSINSKVSTTSFDQSKPPTKSNIRSAKASTLNANNKQKLTDLIRTKNDLDPKSIQLQQNSRRDTFNKLRASHSNSGSFIESSNTQVYNATLSGQRNSVLGHSKNNLSMDYDKPSYLKEKSSPSQILQQLQNDNNKENKSVQFQQKTPKITGDDDEVEALESTKKFEKNEIGDLLKKITINKEQDLKHAQDSKSTSSSNNSNKSNKSTSSNNIEVKQAAVIEPLQEITNQDNKPSSSRSSEHPSELVIQDESTKKVNLEINDDLDATTQQSTQADPYELTTPTNGDLFNSGKIKFQAGKIKESTTDKKNSVILEQLKQELTDPSSEEKVEYGPILSLEMQESTKLAKMPVKEQVIDAKVAQCLKFKIEHTVKPIISDEFSIRYPKQQVANINHLKVIQEPKADVQEYKEIQALPDCNKETNIETLETEIKEIVGEKKCDEQGDSLVEVVNEVKVEQKGEEFCIKDKKEEQIQEVEEVVKEEILSQQQEQPSETASQSQEQPKNKKSIAGFGRKNNLSLDLNIIETDNQEEDTQNPNNESQEPQQISSQIDNPFLHTVTENVPSEPSSTEKANRSCVVHFNEETKRDYLPTPIMTPRDKPLNTPQRLNNNLLDIFGGKDCDGSKAAAHILDDSMLKQAIEKSYVQNSAKKSRNSVKNSIDMSHIPPQSPRNQGITIQQWLKKIKLSDYESNFLDNGYTHFEAFKKDYAFFPTIFDDLLRRFGIYKYGHRLRIMMGLREELGMLRRKGMFRFNQVHTDRELLFPTIREWLSSLLYEKYVDNFIEAGLDDFEFLALQIGFTERPLEQSILASEAGIRNPRERNDLFLRINRVFEAGNEMDPLHFDPKVFQQVLFEKSASTKSESNCNIF